MKEGVISTPDSVCIVKGSRHMKEAREFVDFVTGRDAQTVISMRLDRRSVRMDVEEPSYLPDKEDIHIIYSREDEVNSRKGTWLEHFASIYSRVLEEGGGISAMNWSACLSPTPLSRRSYLPWYAACFS